MRLLYDDFATFCEPTHLASSLDVVLEPARGAARASGKNDVALLPLPTGAHDLQAPEAAVPLRRLPAPLRPGPGDRRATCRARSRERSPRTRTGSTSSSRRIAEELAKTPRWVYASRDKGFDPEAPDEPPAAPAPGGASVTRRRDARHLRRARQQALRRLRRRRTTRASRSAAASSSRCSGPSGCGKTTMLRMIAGFEEVTSGVLRLDGVDVVGVPPYRRAVNTVFQNYALFPHLSVFDNVAFGPRIRREQDARARARVREMLDVVRLGDFADAQAEPALRRPAPARRARARARERPERAAARRAALRARPRAAPPDAARAEAHPARRRHHLRVRDARPGRGAHHVRPHRRDERRAGSSRWARPRRSTTSRRRPSSRASSAART